MWDMADDLPTFLVTYQYVPDMESRRAPYRQDHLVWLRALAGAGQLVFAGATVEPVDTGLLVVRGASVLDVRHLLLRDPYAQADLITAVTVRRLGIAVGG